jgi:hypothetical protein
MNILDEYYIGYKKQGKDRPVLGFIGPNTSKQQQTIDKWSKEYIDAKDVIPSEILQNVPQSGFKIVDVVSRCSTSNKFYRILDPRGFELEISADNLLELMFSSTIENGVIKSECVWGKQNSAALVPVNSEHYKDYLTLKNGPIVLTPGQIYKDKKTQEIIRYEGEFYKVNIGILNIILCNTALKDKTHIKLPEIIKEIKEINTNAFIDNKGKIKIITYFTDYGSSYEKSFDLSSTYKKREVQLIPFTEKNSEYVELFEKYKFDDSEIYLDKYKLKQLNEDVNFLKSTSRYNISGGYYNDHVLLFKTLKELKEFDYESYIKELLQTDDTNATFIINRYHNQFCKISPKEVNIRNISNFRDRMYYHKNLIEYWTNNDEYVTDYLTKRRVPRMLNIIDNINFREKRK